MTSNDHASEILARYAGMVIERLDAFLVSRDALYLTKPVRYHL